MEFLKCLHKANLGDQNVAKIQEKEVPILKSPLKFFCDVKNLFIMQIMLHLSSYTFQLLLKQNVYNLATSLKNTSAHTFLQPLFNSFPSKREKNMDNTIMQTAFFPSCIIAFLS